MPVTNVIVNGSFTQGSSGWSGTDLETSYTENAYLENNSTNRVAEMDGHTGYTTVMQQTVNISHAGTFAFGFRSALRNSVNNTAGEGFRVDILDSSGTVIFTVNVLPNTHSWQTYTYNIAFPAAGNYTVRFTELGPDDSLGAIVDDISLLVCFAAGTLIRTADGLRAVETLQIGDLIQTLDAGLQPLRWIGRRRVTVEEQQADPSLRPVIFPAGSLGNGLPARELRVSPLHRILVDDWRSQLYFAEDQILIPAKALVDGAHIRQAAAEAEVTYVHFLLDGHQIVLAEGIATESFYPSVNSLRGVEADARDELLKLFPELPLGCAPLARPELRGYEALVLVAA